MAMAGPIPMPTDAQILTLAQWLSPAYPVGAFAYSHGLEWLAHSGAVSDGEALAEWLDEVLRQGAGQSDALFLAAAYRAENARALSRINDMCRAFAPARERLAETELQGAAFCEVTAAVFGHDLPPLAFPVAVGRAAALEGLPLRLTAKMYLQAFAANLVAAGTRLIGIGQTESQHLIRRLAPLLESVAEKAIGGSLDDLSGTAFLADIAAMKHETQHSRIFRT